jgi:alanine racemase
MPAFSDAAQAAAKTVEGYVAIDTGMGRIGYLATTFPQLEDIKKITTLSNFRIKGCFLISLPQTQQTSPLLICRNPNIKPSFKPWKRPVSKCPTKTFANSAAIMELPTTHFDTVRPGIILYGCYPSLEVEQATLDIKPVMSVKANIVRLVRVPVGFSVGYGRKFIAERESVIATLPLGYADGYPRPYSSVGWVLVGGKVAPLAGNICMDQCMVDVTDVPGVKEGDEVSSYGYRWHSYHFSR